MQLTKLYFYLLLALYSAACSDTQLRDQQAESGTDYEAVKPYFDTEWAMQKLWDDGLAEVAIYEAERVVYGKNRSFDLTIITVKEDFNSEYNVKTDNYDRKDLFSVMKINQFCRIPTDNYPYHYLTSVFVHRERPWQLHKQTISSQEWCGNTFKALTASGSNYKLNYNSYFDGQGEGNHDLPKELLFEDQLPYTLRALRFKNKLQFKTNVAETQLTNKADKPEIYEAVILTSEATINNQQAWLVEVQLAKGKENKYWFSAEYPNQLLRQQTWDGRNLTLKKISRYAYWEGN